MKKILSSFFILFFWTAFSQQKGDVVLNWSEKKPYSVGDYSLNVPQFDAQNYRLDTYKRQITFNLFLEQPAAVDKNSLQITNVVYESINVSALGDLSSTDIPSKINATLENITARDKFQAFIYLHPIIKDASGYKKVKSFSYTFASSNGNSRLTPGTDPFGRRFNSVLATGEWYRFYVKRSGVYKLDKSFIQSLGINLNGVDPRKIKIYGNGGRMIPLKNSDYYPADLTENAIIVAGENDGVFHDSDFVAFYAEGTDVLNTESDTSINLYSDNSYYYINIQGADGKRITPMAQPTSASTVSINTFDDLQTHEIDAVNLARVGRRWFGEVFDMTTEMEFDFNIPNIVTSSPANLEVYVGAVAAVATDFKVDANGQTVNTITLAKTAELKDADGRGSTANITAAENIKIKLTYNNNGVPGSKGYLDYIRIRSKRNLVGMEKQFPFQYNAAATNTGIGEYQIARAANINQIWDVTDIFNVTNIENNSQSNLSFKAGLGEIRKYLAVDFRDMYTPLKESQTRVANQNLKGTIFNNAQGQPDEIDYVIITPTLFFNAAEKLANFHRNYSQLKVKVVTLESIYLEFSSGKQDIGAIRNFMKYVYRNPLNPTRKVKYLNLFGDASYDFKNRVSIFSNFVPIYHALDGYSDGEASFASDDFFGSLDEEDGGNIANVGGRMLDVAVGRMIANSSTQAEELTNKVIDYHDIQSYGNWRNNLVAIADDADKSSDSTLQQKTNSLVDAITSQKPFINGKKILLDSYQQQTSAGGGRYPVARQDIFNAFENGALVFNYLGHGGEDGLAQERIFQKSDAQNLNNKYKYPLFVTITCDFSRFDNPFRQTAGEFTYWNPRGGAISMITTIRSIGQGTGEDFNDILAKYLFSYGSNDYVSIAEALRLTKTDRLAPVTNVVFYLGDPALMLAIPRPKILLTHVNDVAITEVTDDFKALSHMKITGNVLDENNNLLPTYNGELAVQIFDKTITRQTLNNDNLSPSMNFTTLGETIFRGNASVKDGKFEFGFVVPRDIATNVGNGRISFYSKRGQIFLDKTGYDNTIKVGGVNLNAAVDNTGPRVKLYMNDQTFVSGGITNESPIFLAFLEDENGMNTASGIGHDMVAILDGDENNPYKLNDYYETELDNYTKGKLKFPFRNLAVGLHTVKFIAWDVYNNPVEAEIQFIVVGDETITIKNVLNYPNPFVNYTQFWFTHNKPFEPLEVQVQVITITGKIVWTKNQTITTDGFLSREITWDGKDDFGDKIGKGVYVYKLTVKSLLTNTKTHKYEKLVIL